MTPEQKAAFIIAQAAVSVARVAAMQADNAACIRNFLEPRWDYGSFMDAANEATLGHNAVITFFEG